MHRELRPDEVTFNVNLSCIDTQKHRNSMTAYDDQVHSKVEKALDINSEGYNVYIIDDFSKDKLKDIMNFIGEKYKKRSKPCDVCFVVENDEKCPRILKMPAGFGEMLKSCVTKLQAKYVEIVNDFYNSTDIKEKNEILDELESEKNILVDNLIKRAKEEGFELKAGDNGFTFTPIKDGKSMSEKEFDLLGDEKKQDILSKIEAMKKMAQRVIEKLTVMELEITEKLKKFISVYVRTSAKSTIDEYLGLFKESSDVITYLENISDNIELGVTKAYTMSFTDDEAKIKASIYKAKVNVLVDNKNESQPRVIYEDDPSVINLLGNIEYENKSGSYATDVSHINAGSLIKASGGCLILKASSLLSNSLSYHYLKKSLISGSVDLNYYKGELGVLSLGSFKPDSVSINEKVIIIGDFKTYSLLYNNDEDFKKLFKIRALYKSTVTLDEVSTSNVMAGIYKICKTNDLLALEDSAIYEMLKYLSRKADNRSKILIENREIKKVLTLADNDAKTNKQLKITDENIKNIVYEEDAIEKEVMEAYSQKKLMIDTTGSRVGQVNGLTVLDTGYLSFGRPVKITCSCSCGTGEIYDANRESSLSGNIHNKAVNILKGYILSLVGGYEKVPINFRLSFEQIYGMIEGDSASAAEAVSIISALSKIGIKQNIAVTGSINQFGEIQPVGGINEKIEGFFKICSQLGGIKGKGVLIPDLNTNDLNLKREVEKAVEDGDFHIYAMSNITDAVEILMGSDNLSSTEVFENMKLEIKKYTVKDSNKDSDKK